MIRRPADSPQTGHRPSSRSADERTRWQTGHLYLRSPSGIRVRFVGEGAFVPRYFTIRACCSFVHRILNTPCGYGGDGWRSHMKVSNRATRKLHVQKIGRKQEIGGGFPNPWRPGEIRAIPPPCGHGFTHKPYVAIQATKPDPPFVWAERGLGLGEAPGGPCRTSSDRRIAPEPRYRVLSGGCRERIVPEKRGEMPPGRGRLRQEIRAQRTRPFRTKTA